MKTVRICCNRLVWIVSTLYILLLIRIRTSELFTLKLRRLISCHHYRRGLLRNNLLWHHSLALVIKRHPLSCLRDLRISTIDLIHFLHWILLLNRRKLLVWTLESWRTSIRKCIILKWTILLESFRI
jgi:hypothetical protein